MWDIAQPFGISGEERVHDNSAAGVGEQVAAQADEAAAGDLEFHAYAPVAVVVHLFHLRLTHAELLDDDTDECLRHVDGQQLDRLHQPAVNALGDNLRLADRELVAFAAHHLDEDGQLQLAASHDAEGVGAVGVFHAQRNVGEQLFLQTIAQIARGDVLAFSAGEGRGVDHELYGDGRLVDGDDGQRRGIFDIGDGLADVDALNPGHGDNVAQLGQLDVGALESGEGKQLGDLGFVHAAIALGDGHFFSKAQGAVEHARNGNAAEIIAVVEVGDQHL